MIDSYFLDASVFSNRNDRVNRYAALVYAHGWMDAGKYLGFYELNSESLDFHDENLILGQEIALSEKMNRYERMLESAICSVIPVASSGSPAFAVSNFILKYTAGGLISGKEYKRDERSVSALGDFSYYYGWLDTTVRCGLLRIVKNSDLFTTEK